MKLLASLLLALAVLPAVAAKGTATATVVTPADLRVILADPGRAIVTSITTVQQGPYTVVTVNFN